MLDETDDLVAMTAGVSRFLAVESCGQCTPCKLDGLALADLLARMSRGEAGASDLDAVRSRVSTVADEARCYLATQHQVVVGSLLDRFGDQVQRHVRGGAHPSEPALVAELVDIEGDVALVDAHHLEKQPDWTFDEEWSGKTPAERFGEHRAPEPLED